jgi:hypothetical protein
MFRAKPRRCVVFNRRAMVSHFLCTYAIYAKRPLPPNLTRTPASALNDGRVYDRRYEPGGGLAVRSKVSLAVIDKAVHHELARL